MDLEQIRPRERVADSLPLHDFFICVCFIANFVPYHVLRSWEGLILIALQFRRRLHTPLRDTWLFIVVFFSTLRLPWHHDPSWMNVYFFSPTSSFIYISWCLFFFGKHPFRVLLTHSSDSSFPSWYSCKPEYLLWTIFDERPKHQLLLAAVYRTSFACCVSKARPKKVVWKKDFSSNSPSSVTSVCFSFVVASSKKLLHDFFGSHGKCICRMLFVPWDKLCKYGINHFIPDY